MFKNKSKDGSLNISGKNIAAIRKRLRPKVSQRLFAERLQLAGLDLDKNAIQKMERGQRFITDIELKAISQTLGVSADELLEE